MTWHGVWVDYYELLEVSSTAREAVIEAAYKKLSLDYHPDRGGDTATMQALNDARDTLLDEAKRRQYDLEHTRRSGGGQERETAQRRAEEAERRAKRAEREAEAAEERARRAESDADRATDHHDTRSADEADRSRSDGRSGPSEQERDRAMERLRRVANQERKQAAGARAGQQREIDEQRLAAERQAEASAAQQSTGLFGRLKRGVTCGIGAHKGQWFYLEADSCDQQRLCPRCGNHGEQTSHEWAPAQRIVDSACEFVTFCARCDDEHVSLDHQWQAEYLSTDCRQVDVCRYCSEVDHDSVRVRHTWGGWRADSSTTRSRACTRCGEREAEVEPERLEDEPDPVPISRSSGNRESGRSRGFTGRWQAADGSLHDLHQSGNRVQIQGASIHGVLMQGAGVVQGRRAMIDCVNNLGVHGRLVVDLTGDGSAINGIWHGVNGTSAVLMHRIG